MIPLVAIVVLSSAALDSDEEELKKVIKNEYVPNDSVINDLRKDFTVECDITQLRGQIGSVGNIISKVYRNK